MDKKEYSKSALSISKGVKDTASMQSEAVQAFLRKKKKPISSDKYLEGILDGDKVLLSQAITLIESTHPGHQEIAQQIISGCLPHAGNSFRIGITGVPGVGKSSFIEAFGHHLALKGKKLAVLAIDPSSEKSRGSILGDKTRMEKLSQQEHVFIRPSPSAGSLGGVARKTRESLVLCEAAGYDVVFIETVGVGQSETAVRSMVDFFLLLMLAGAGDELQGIKRGIMEMADVIAITKADGDNKQKAEMALREYANALHLFPPAPSGWIPRVLTTSARQGTGLEEIWKALNDYFSLTSGNGFLQQNRKNQSIHWMNDTIKDNLIECFYHTPVVKEQLEQIEEKVLNRTMTPFQAASFLLNKFRSND